LFRRLAIFSTRDPVSTGIAGSGCRNRKLLTILSLVNRW